MRKHLTPGRLALVAILGGALAIRLYGLRHGLPFIYHSDESQHFTNYAVAMFDGSLNPHYFQNPATYTYLVHFALWVQGFDDIARQYVVDPSDIFETARLVAVALCLLGVAAIYAVGRRLWGTFEGLVAAAVLAFAVLPVAYSRYAVTDVGVLLPMAMSVYATVKIAEDGRRRYYVIAGLGLGLTVAFKFTAGLVLVPILVAAAIRARRQSLRDIVIGVAIVGGLAIAVFAITNPYFLLDIDEAIDELRSQRFAAGERKPGQVEENPYGFYLSSLTWGIGWGALVAAAAGLVVQLRRGRTRAVLLALFPLLLFGYLGLDADRYFARWMLPTYPVLALFAGVGVATGARALSPRPLVRVAALAVLIAVVMAQPIVTNIHTGSVLRKDDTRELARNYMLANLPNGTRIVVDAVAIRDEYDLPLLGIERKPGEPEFVSGFGAPPKKHPGSYPPEPVRTTRFLEDLRPGRIDAYRDEGFCVVVTMSWLRERAEIAGLEDAVAYYDRLERESKVLFRASPYDDPNDPVPFDFDQTHLYYDGRYDRTGPEVVVRKLDGCRDGISRRVSEQARAPRAAPRDRPRRTRSRATRQARAPAA